MDDDERSKLAEQVNVCIGRVNYYQTMIDRFETDLLVETNPRTQQGLREGIDDARKALGLSEQDLTRAKNALRIYDLMNRPRDPDRGPDRY